jgi:general secretion pathway protein G
VDKFVADKGRYPEDLGELVARQYLRKIPIDPLTDRTDTWLTVPPPDDSLLHSGVYDIHSGAPGRGSDGTAYATW